VVLARPCNMHFTSRIENSESHVLRGVYRLTGANAQIGLHWRESWSDSRVEARPLDPYYLGSQSQLAVQQLGGPEDPKFPISERLRVSFPSAKSLPPRARAI